MPLKIWSYKRGLAALKYNAYFRLIDIHKGFHLPVKIGVWPLKQWSLLKTQIQSLKRKLVLKKNKSIATKMFAESYS